MLTLLATLALSAPQSVTPDSLVTVQSGTMPVILSAPHDGTAEIPGVEVRESKPGKAKFVTVRDVDSAKLAQEIADDIEKETGQRPYVVVAKFSRKYVDANRGPDEAFQSDAAKPYYEAYHHAIENARDAILKAWGKGLLLDVHGQGKDAEAIFRGTQNGSTVQHLLKEDGADALVGPDGLLGQLSKAGVKVVPPTLETKEDPNFNGGYIVQHYGVGSFDAVQLETGRTLRTTQRAETAKRIADAVVMFAKRYLQ